MSTLIRRILIRLYPATWRDRYAAEFGALMDQIPLTVRVVGDVFVAGVATRIRRVFEGPYELTVAAIAGTAGGATWASTIALGSTVGWGRYGRDLGSVILIVAALAFLVAQAKMAPPSSTRGRSLARFGLGVSAAGLAVLLMSLTAAVALEHPLSIRLGPSPAEVWTMGMLLMLVGAGLLGVVLLHRTGNHRVPGALMLMAAVPLTLALLVPVGAQDRREAYRTAADGTTMVVVSGVTGTRTGWFTTNPVVGGAGAIFGMAWMIIGIQESRHPGGPRPRTPGLAGAV